MELFKLCALNILVLYRSFVDTLLTAFKYYGTFSFFKADSALILTYLFNNPYSLSKRFLKAKGVDNLYQYGETPLITFAHILKEAGVTAKDTVFELGCGRGRTLFFLSEVIGCKAVGIDFIPEFIDRANRIKERFNLKNVSFHTQDMLEANLTGASVIYLYGTCLEKEFIEKLIVKFSKLPKGVRIITVSYPLTDYTDEPFFEVMRRFDGRFTWGVADVYVHSVK